MSDINTEEPSARADEDHARLGAKLREAREYLGVSQELVAEHLGIPRASVSAIETGKRKVSSLELRDLAKLYRRPVEYFLGAGSEVEEPPDETVVALYRTTRSLSDQDRQQLLQFARFLKGAGKAPVRENESKST
jgi:transcriptional regulator with XRE-family HTH domain